ncbi:MAG: hypothetical protein NXI20_16000 [bacterium]|nr:hypothetical protein [bacterium]
MKATNLILTLLIVVFSIGCQSETDRLIEAINYSVKEIDSNHRVKIVEDDFHEGDTIHKIRGYYMDNALLKLVSVTRTSHFVRDDYFYFDHAGEPMFTGHMLNLKDEHDAAEYKYYYHKGEIIASLYWEDHYVPGKQFPHEEFEKFDPDKDSLVNMENERLAYFLEKLNTEGFSVQEENENLEANTSK